MTIVLPLQGITKAYFARSYEVVLRITEMIHGKDFKGLSQTLMSAVQEDQAYLNAVRLPR